MELIDQSLQIGSNALASPEIMSTVEKIKRAGTKKKGYVSPPSDGMLGQFQERLANLESKRAPIQTVKEAPIQRVNENQIQTANEHQMQIELLPRLEFPVKKEKASEGKGLRSASPRRLPMINPFFNEVEEAINLEKAIDCSDNLRKSDAATQTTSLQSLSTNANYDHEHYNRRQEEPTQRRHKANESSYRAEKSSREKLSEINFHEEVYDEREDNRLQRHYRGYPEAEDYSFHHAPRRNPYDLRPRSASNSVTKSNKTNSNQKMRNIKQEARGSPYKTLGGIKDHKNDYYISTYPRICDVDIKGEERPKKGGHSSKGRRNSGKRDQCSHEDESCCESNEEGENNVRVLSGSKASKKPKTGRGIHGLHDWINRRITGYLIFQNTFAGTIGRGKDGSHLNSIAGQQWKKLSKAEKEEYKSLALNVRVNLKKEYRDVDKESPELKELQDLIEKAIKKVKKEQE